MNRVQDPPPRYGVRTDPVTGRTETYELPAPIDLERSRKELRDVLHGSEWFDDPLAAPKAPADNTICSGGSEDVRDLFSHLGMVEDPPGSGIWKFP